MKVIGTAGHIDHGKSALVHRLTGVDPDRLDEEKRRGMTIDLGFAALTLPSGAHISIVDVPGHERFIRNMLAGAGGIDVALLVVAADEGIMPQTREHVHIIDLLGVHQGVVALTKADLVDDEWLELIGSEVSELLLKTTLAGSPVVPVSATTGFGLPELLRALDASVATAPDHPGDRAAYLPIDRVFTVAGFGTVVTGTLHEGRLHSGEEMEIVPRGVRARIRTLQSHGVTVDTAAPGSRVAVNLAGAAREQAGRGDVLARPGSVAGVSRFDGTLRVLPDAPFAVKHGTEVTIHIGSAERAAILTILNSDELAPGQEGWVQVRLESAVPAVLGQRFIVRMPSPGRTIAGGEVADLAPRHRRRDPAATRRLVQLRSSSPQEVVMAALTDGRPHTTAQVVAVSGLLNAPEVLTQLSKEGMTVKLGQFFVSALGWDAMAERVQRLLRIYQAAHPLHQGMPREELRRKLGWSDAVWQAGILLLEKREMLRQTTTVIATTDHAGGTANRQGEVAAILDLLSKEPFSPPSGGELFSQADAALLAAMAGEGQIVQVTDALFFTRTAFEEMRGDVVDLIRRQGPITVAQARDRLGTTRKFALALLEHLDAERVTRRHGDERVLGSKAGTCE